MRFDYKVALAAIILAILVYHFTHAQQPSYPVNKPHLLTVFVVPDANFTKDTYELQLSLETNTANIFPKDHKNYMYASLFLYVSDRFPDIQKISVSVDGKVATLRLTRPLRWQDFGYSNTPIEIGIPLVVGENAVKIAICPNPYIYVGDVDGLPHFTASLCTEFVKIKYGEEVNVDPGFNVYAVEI